MPFQNERAAPGKYGPIKNDDPETYFTTAPSEFEPITPESWRLIEKDWRRQVFSELVLWLYEEHGRLP